MAVLLSKVKQMGILNIHLFILIQQLKQGLILNLVYINRFKIFCTE